MAGRKKDREEEPFTEHIEHVDLESVLGTSYIDYSMSVIVARAIPDVRDGLKPVQRRIAYSMHKMGLTHNVAFKKCATTVGDVLGHYHPHGDASVYDALARMAQDFSMRYPLIEGHGNFGSMDGDPPAAYRYTESRMSPIMEELLRDIDKNTVDWSPNFDGTIDEPDVLPARLPNLLLNGASGIAVGMSSRIPPHNLEEIVDAVIRVIDNEIKNRDTTVDELLEIVKGPDFPTGGLLLGDSYKDIYRTGHGTAVMQATYEIEDAGRKKNIVFTSVPYEVNKADLVTKIARYSRDHRLDVSDVRDETSRDGVRIVVELKKDASPEIILNNLLEHTDLRCNFSANMLCIVDGQPKTLSLPQMLDYYLEFQKDVVTRRTVFEKDKAEKRKHVVEGLILATEHIDEIIEIIRNADEPDTAKKELIKRFGFSDIQAQTILDIRLRSLTGLERRKLEEELAQLIKETERCDEILSDPKKLLRLIKKELQELKKKYSDERKTGHRAEFTAIKAEDLIEEEPCVVLRTNLGYVKRIRPDGRTVLQYRADDPGTVQDDYVEDAVLCTTLSDLFFFTDTGRVYSVKAHTIDETAKNARGTAIASVLGKMSPDERVIGMESENDYQSGRTLMIMTKKGTIKRIAFSDLLSQKSVGQIMIKLEEDDEIRGMVTVREDDSVILTTKNGYCIAYAAGGVRPMGRNAYGMCGISLEDGDEAVSIQIYNPEKEIIAVTERGFAKRLKCGEVRLFSGHHSRGVRCFIPSEKEKTGRIRSVIPLENDSDSIVFYDEKNECRTMPAAKIVLYSKTNPKAKMTNLTGVRGGTDADITKRLREVPADSLNADAVKYPKEKGEENAHI